MLSFIVYDWDGHNASEDDFLGSAHILLTKVGPRYQSTHTIFQFNSGLMLLIYHRFISDHLTHLSSNYCAHTLLLEL